jgi:hypothetical protein
MSPSASSHRSEAPENNHITSFPNRLPEDSPRIRSSSPVDQPEVDLSVKGSLPCNGLGMMGMLADELAPSVEPEAFGREGFRENYPN